MKNNYFMLFACCIPVKGIHRSIICDTQRSKYIFIDNDVYDILIKTKKKSLSTILNFFPQDSHLSIVSFFDFLVTNELGFYTESPSNFPPINLEWLHPSPITNAIIDVSLKNKDDIVSTLNQMEKLRCKAIQIRFYDNLGIDFISKYIQVTKNYSAESIEIILPYHEGIDEDCISNIIELNHRVSLVLFYSARKTELKKRETYAIAYSQECLSNHTHCGSIFSNMFSLNILTFTESQHHNTCLNRKISIDAEGNIKNCPSMAQSFGNIRDTTLEEALAHPDFKKYWNVKKDDILVCKDCEFRHICTDCRAYIENPEDMYSKPLKCGYNPYTAEWSEWSTNPLKQKAIDYYGMKDLIKKEENHA